MGGHWYVGGFNLSGLFIFQDIYYLIVYPLKLFYTSQCEQSDKEHNDPAEILLTQCFWSNEDLQEKRYHLKQILCSITTE